MARRKEVGCLGFVDLEVLNLAMLTKQAWKLICRPHNLFARF